MAKFLSKFDNLTICIRPNTKKVENGIVQHIQGDRITFERGKFLTKDKAKIKILRDKIAGGDQTITEVEDSESE